MLGSWTKKKKKRHLEEEDSNRDGQWTRDFSARAESWPMIEHWAVEHGYRMIACKPRRRMYVKSSNEHFYSRYLDIRHEDTRVVLSGWIGVGFRLRAFCLFLMPSILPIEPKGFLGIRTRRRACHEFNVLLSRFRQPTIVGSEGLHIADLDLSTLLMSGIFLGVLTAFSIFSSTKMEVTPGLSNGMLSELLQKISWLVVLGTSFLSVHHWGVTKRFSESWKKGLSASILSLVFTGLSLFLITRTVHEFAKQKISHHCLWQLNSERCETALSLLSAKERADLTHRLETLQKEIVLRK